jgi:hypothetical protein
MSDIEEKNEHKILEWLKEFFLIEIIQDKPAEHLIQQLNIAWLFGIIYFILGFLEAAAEYYRIMEDKMIFSVPFYICMKISVLIAFFFFQRGFIIVGHLFRNYLLKIMSFILICGMFLVISYDIASLFYEPVEGKFMLGAEALTFGGIGIIFGISLIKLQKPLGQIPFIAGIFEIFAACFFLTVILGFVGEIILIPAELAEIVLLFKVVELIKTKNPVYQSSTSE